MRVTSVDMGRVGVCMLLYCSQIHYSHMVVQKQTRVLGVGLCKKSKGPEYHEREDRYIRFFIFKKVLLLSFLLQKNKKKAKVRENMSRFQL